MDENSGGHAIGAGNGQPDKALGALALTKLVVDDLEAGERFYSAVFGLSVFRRTPKGQSSFGKEEIAMSSAGPGGAHVLILMKFANRPCPPPGCCFLGFTVVDADAVVAKAEELGAKIVMPVTAAPGEDVRFAVFKDPAGHMVEIIETGNRPTAAS